MITPIEQKIIDFIIEYYKETLFYPNYDEIGASIGRNKSTVHTHMKKLEDEGIIIRKQDNSPQYRLVNMQFIKGMQTAEIVECGKSFIEGSNKGLNDSKKIVESERWKQNFMNRFERRQ